MDHIRKTQSSLLALTFLSSPLAHGVVVFNNGGPNTVDTTIDDYVEVYPGPGESITTVVFNSPANILQGDPDGDDSVYLFGNSVATINGGTFVQDVGADDDSFITIHDGNLQDDLQAFGNATLILNGGTLADNLEGEDNASITVGGGSIGGIFEIYDNVQATITGGTFQTDFGVFSRDAQAVITGGTFTRDVMVDGLLTIRGGNFLGQDLFWGMATAGGRIILDGSDFSLDGVPVAYGDLIPETGILTGVLANGDAINIPVDRNPFESGNPVDIGVISLVPEPTSSLLLALSGLSFSLRRRR